MRLLQRKVVDQDRSMVSRERGEPSSRLGHSGRTPGDPVGVGRRIEQQLVGAHDPVLRSPLHHIVDGYVVWPEAIVVEGEKGRNDNRPLASRPNRIGILRRHNPKRAGKSDQRQVARFAPRGLRGSRAAFRRPQFMIAGRPDQSGKAATQKLERVRQIGFRVPTSPARISQSCDRRSIDRRAVRLISFPR